MISFLLLSLLFGKFVIVWYVSFCINPLFLKPFFTVLFYHFLSSKPFILFFFQNCSCRIYHLCFLFLWFLLEAFLNCGVRRSLAVCLLYKWGSESVCLGGTTDCSVHYICSGKAALFIGRLGCQCLRPLFPQVLLPGSWLPQSRMGEGSW